MSESISYSHEKDGTLVVTVPKGINVGRVLVQEEGTCIGSLYYQDHFADVSKKNTISRPEKRTDKRAETHACDSISRQAAIDAADRTDYLGLAVEDVKRVTDEVVKELKKLPSAQPERKKGEWIKEDSTHETVCSVCHGIRRDNRISHTNFCNCCGADMRGEQK